MSPPPDNPPQNLDRRRSDGFQKHMDERFDALEKLIKSGFPRILVNLLPDCASDKAEQDLMTYGRRANNDIKYDYVNRFSNSFEIEGW